MKMRSGSYHKNCFRCGVCKISLDYSLACDGPSGDVFCKNCYGKSFGPLASNLEFATGGDTAVIKPSKNTNLAIEKNETIFSCRWR